MKIFKKREPLFVILIFSLLTVIVFRKFFFQRQVPFPANLLVSFYSPWQNYEWSGYPNGPANKPIGFDNLRIFYPFKKLTIDQLKQGQWPLWNPYNFSGSIHLATYQSAVFYPLNLFYFILPLIDAWSLLVILQPILSGFFMYLFLKELKLSFKAVLFGSIAFAFSGWMLAWLEEDLVVEHSALWLPLILYSEEKIIQKFSKFNFFLLVTAITSCILAGFLQLTLYVLLTALAWAIFRLFSFKKIDFKIIFPILLSFLFSLLLSSIHLWPAMEAYFSSPRRLVDVKFLFEEYLMPPQHLITFLAPDFWGNPAVYNHIGTGFYHEKIIYFGITAFLFALSALLFKSSNRPLNFYKWFSLLTLALGFYPVGWLLYFSRLPLLSVLIPSRIFFLSTFGFCILSSFGLHFYLQDKINWRQWLSLLLVNVVLFISLWFVVLRFKCYLFPHGCNQFSLNNLILPTALFIISSFLIFFPWLITKISPYFFGFNYSKCKTISFFGLITLCFFSSFYFANKYLYFSERRFVFPQVPAFTKLKELAGINRVWGYGNGYIEKNTNAYYNLFIPGGYDALFPQRYGELLYTQEKEGQITAQINRGFADLKQASEREKFSDNWYRQRLLSLLGVKYVLEAKGGLGKEWQTQEDRFPQEYFRLSWEDEKFRIWEYKLALPRAFLVSDYLVENDPQKIVDSLFAPRFDLRQKIILEEKSPLKLDSRDLTDQKVDFLKYSPNFIELATNASSSSLLFLSDNYYPGWQALVDQKPTKILRANYSFRAIAVPPGQHRIIFSYQPLSFFWGLRVSLLSLFIFSTYLIFAKKKS